MRFRRSCEVRFAPYSLREHEYQMVFVIHTRRFILSWHEMASSSVLIDEKRKNEGLWLTYDIFIRPF